MARILVVDDRALNREYLVTLLGYLRHTLTEACDGVEALEAVRASPPDLIITDIDMPRLTGIEFIEQMQRDPRSANIPVIFHSATYRVPEARKMALRCTAAAVIPKPSDPEVMISAVKLALGESQAIEVAPPPPRGWNPALVALMDLQCALAEERDPNRTLELICNAAPSLIAAQCAVLGLEDEDTGVLSRVLVCGVDASAPFAAGARVPAAFALRVAEPAQRRVWKPKEGPPLPGLPPAHPPVYSLLVVPLAGAKGNCGWFYLANRDDGTAFTAADEDLLGLLARQAAMVHENCLLALRASRDGLTGLLNRREFDAAFERECERARREASPLALVLADVDHFKECNDRFGHASGDAVLRAIAAELEKSVRGYDQIFRYGGEEFAILLPGAGAADALLRAEEYRQRIGALEVCWDGQMIGQFTLSLGVVAYPEYGADALLRAADLALYAAKHGGRNRSCAAPRALPPHDN